MLHSGFHALLLEIFRSVLIKTGLDKAIMFTLQMFLFSTPPFQEFVSPAVYLLHFLLFTCMPKKSSDGQKA